MALPESAHGEKPGKLLRETGRWGDGRFVAGEMIRSKAFSPSGRLAVAASRGVIVWDLKTLAEVGRIPLPYDPQNPDVCEVVLSPDGRRVTIGSALGAGTWDLRSGRRLSHVSWTGFKRPGVALAASGDMAAVWEKPEYGSPTPARIELWDLRKKTSQPVAAGGPVPELRFRDDDRSVFPLEIGNPFSTAPFIVSRSATGATELQAPVSETCRTDKQGPCTLTRPNGNWIVEVRNQPRAGTSGPDRPLSLVSVTDTRSKRRLVIAETRPYAAYDECHGDVCGEYPTHDSENARVTLDRRGRRLATIISQSAPGYRLEVWDLPSQRKIAGAPLNAGVENFALSESGARILMREVAGAHPKLKHDLVVYAADTAKPLWRRENVAWGGLSSTASGMWIVEEAGLVVLLEQPSDLVPGRVVAWDIDTGDERLALPIGRYARGRPLVAGGHLALPASSTGFTIVSARGGPAPLPPDRHAAAVARLALSDDGALLASAGHDGKLIVRSLAGRPAARVVTADAINDLAFTPGGHQLLAAGRLHATRWDGDTGAPLGEVRATLGDGDGRHVFAARLFRGRDGVGFLRNDHSLEIRPWQGNKGIRTLTSLCPRGSWWDGVSLAGRGWCESPDDNNTFVLRELESGAVRSRADGGAAAPRWVIADDGRHVLYVENANGGVVLATTDASDAPARIHERRSSFTAAFSPDSRLAVTALWEDQTVHVWDVKTRTELDAFDLSASLDHATAVAFSKRGDELFVGTARGLVYRFSVSRR
jgi:WD40 repeat protein